MGLLLKKLRAFVELECSLLCDKSATGSVQSSPHPSPGGSILLFVLPLTTMPQIYSLQYFYASGVKQLMKNRTHCLGYLCNSRSAVYGAEISTPVTPFRICGWCFHVALTSTV